MTDRIIGSAFVRCLAGALAALAVLCVGRSGGIVDAWHEVATWQRTVWVVTTFAATVLSSRRLYRRWEAVAERMNRVMLRLVFGFVYLVAVPPFALWSKLAKRLRAAEADTFWISRPERRTPAELFDGMD